MPPQAGTLPWLSLLGANGLLAIGFVCPIQHFVPIALLECTSSILRQCGVNGDRGLHELDTSTHLAWLDFALDHAGLSHADLVASTAAYK